MPSVSSRTPAPPARSAQSAFQSHAAAVYRFMRRRLARAQDADDLTQEVFIRFLRIDTDKLVSKPLAYLYGIAAHVVHEFRIHAEQEHDCVVYDSVTVENVSELPEQLEPHELADRVAVQQQLEQALKRLPRMHRGILLMVKRDGMTHEEVAKTTGLNARTVERYVMQAMTRLRMMQWDR